MQMRVKRTELAADDIRVFDLEALDRGALAPQAPGSHIDVTGPGGITRQYSLCQPPGETGYYRIAVKREPRSRGGSEAMHVAVSENDVLEVSAPRNSFHWQAEKAGSVLIAGGIGITPILPMALTAARNGQNLALYYFARSTRHAVFQDQITQTLAAGDFCLELALEAAQTASRIDDIVRTAPAGWQIYACGPGPMLDCVRAAADRHGATSRLTIESFTAAPALEDGESFEVELARSGRFVSVAGNQTILDALLEAGIDIEFSCEQGICGTCIQRVLEGEPEHRDDYLTDAERAAGDQIAVCVSRARSGRLKLDL